LFGQKEGFNGAGSISLSLSLAEQRRGSDDRDYVQQPEEAGEGGYGQREVYTILLY
jgi:hypothetical protein